MIIDRRKDNYDELQILAGDTRNRRRRANILTSALIAGGMILASAFVSTTNKQAEQLGNAKQTAEDERDVVQLQLAAAKNQIAVLTSERDIYRQNANWFANLAPEMKLSDAVSKLNFVVNGDGEKIVTEERLSNVVWVVDGSRRFPMTDGDILWIPEGNFWVQLVSESDSDPDDTENDDEDLRRVNFYYDRRPTNDAEGGIRRYLGGATRYYEEKGKWPIGTHGNSDCVQLTLHYNSRRPGFSDPKYVDMEVLLYNSDPDCPVGGRTIVAGEEVPNPPNL